MKIKAVHPFSLDVDQVMGIFFDRDIISRRNDLMGCRRVEIIRLERGEDEAHLEIVRDMQPSAKVPGALRSFQRDWNRVTQREHWRRTGKDEWTCEYRVHIADVPARLTGMMQLQAKDKGCANHVELDVDCRIPFLGHKVAGFLSEDSALKIDREYTAILDLIQA
ncbi:MAG: DUF2505 domain-containing protein [Hahellaceae bacterium]|nr:DUF2505 domain-containing protein [Hahellaceae bacterium]